MPVPTYDQFIEPLLRYLAEHPDGSIASDACEAVATRAGLSPEDRLEMLPSGAQAVYRNRIGWAHDRLKRSGLSSRQRRGFWKLTGAGVAFAATHGSLPENELQGLAIFHRTTRLASATDGTSCAPAAGTLEPSISVTQESPEERIDAAISELRESVARDLLELIGHAPPEFFEYLVLELLHAMGYGTNRSDLQRVGGPGDGGIDGIISLDRLGLEKVYVQAKRWKNTVGSPDIQGFMGALQLQSATKGVFITTSGFTKDAKDAAARARGTIVLVDGEMLTSLMIDHGVGVSHKPLRVPKVDNDYFEEG
jgi:restriction system protein